MIIEKHLIDQKNLQYNVLFTVIHKNSRSPIFFKETHALQMDLRCIFVITLIFVFVLFPGFFGVFSLRGSYIRYSLLRFYSRQLAIFLRQHLCLDTIRLADR